MQSKEKPPWAPQVQVQAAGPLGQVYAAVAWLL